LLTGRKIADVQLTYLRQKKSITKSYNASKWRQVEEIFAHLADWFAEKEPIFVSADALTDQLGN
jgi:hypothetical protein